MKRRMFDLDQLNRMAGYTEADRSATKKAALEADGEAQDEALEKLQALKRQGEAIQFNIDALRKTKPRKGKTKPAVSETIAPKGETRDGKTTRGAGRPPKCKGPFDCANDLLTRDEKELKLCTVCQRKMTQRIREENGTAPQPPQPLTPAEDL